MERPNASNLWLPYLTLIISFLLATIHWPGPGDAIAPEWVMLVVIYWVLALPYRFGIFFAFFVGLVVDVHGGIPLGVNALAMAIIAYIVLAVYQRMRIYPPVQQAAVLFFLVLLYLIIQVMLRSLLGNLTAPSLWALAPSLASALIWPAIFLTLRSLRIRYRVR